ncbi:MAG: HpaII family restriction endonuclease [Bacteroidales bacterium]|nr:HpaII family restriction endonuclease [Bacteroidales bacterium]
MYLCREGKVVEEATVVKGSGEHTNFVFEVVGEMDDEKMGRFNGMFHETEVKGERRRHVATGRRMGYLRELGCDIRYVGEAGPNARANLIKCGGLEMPLIIGGMLKKFYYENLGGFTSMEDCVDYLAERDVAGYGFDGLRDAYYGKVANFLLCSFTGMKLGTPWNGRQEVNGGYIVVKNNGDVVAFHSTIADEFKDFLVRKMRMEGPSHQRHGDMVIYREGDRYLLKLGLQARFVLHQ